MQLLGVIVGLLLPLMASAISGPLPFQRKPGPLGCGMFEEFRRCGPSCPPTCDTLKDVVCCEVHCIAGCFCADGYILEKDPKTGPRKCVPLNQCPSPGMLSFEHPTLQVLEGSGKVIIPVVRLNGSYGLISARYRVVNPAGPYADITGELVFPDGVVARTVEIPLQDNQVRDPDLAVRLELFEPSKKTSIVTGTLILTILDDDMIPGYLELEKTQFSVPENVGSVRVQVLRREGSDGQLRVKYRTVPVSAFTNADFSPTTGEMVFEEGETSQTLTVSIVDDEIREAAENFKIEFFDFTHGPGVLNFRRRGSLLTADVIIVDNDMKPGILQLEQPSYRVQEDIGTVELAVMRLDGQDGQIWVRFEAIGKTAKPGQHFEPEMGELVFEEGERRKIIRMKVLDNSIREPNKLFEVLLLDPRPGPGTINFRGLGTIQRATVTIIDDDMNPGVLQLERRTYDVMEDVGSVRVDVVREGGKDGRLVVQYQTQGLTAKENRDFVPASGELVFEEGEERKSILLQIKEDEEKEPLETLEVQLFNPTPGPGIVHFRGLGSVEKAIITIRDNDMTPGILLLETDTLDVREDAGTLPVAVTRLDGTDGQVRVHYQTVPKTAAAGKDFESASGDLVFEEGETMKVIPIRILNDDVREPSKYFEIQLVDPTPGSGVLNFRGLGSISVATITITDDDMRPGSFVLERPTYEIQENDGMVKIGVVRVGGSDGQIRVKHRAVPLSAHVFQDFSPSEGELVFEEGQTRKEIVIQIVDDDRREPSKNFKVELIDATPSPGVINFRRFTANPTALVTIIDDDMKPGTLQFENPSYEVYERVGTVKVGVVRMEGSDGELHVKYKTIAKTARPDRDFLHSEGELVFGEREIRKEIAIRIVDNDLSESTKTFEVELTDLTPGLGVINFRRFTSNPTAKVAILDDDMKPGTFKMEKPSFDVPENIGHVKIGVMRVDGRDGEIRVKYKTVPKTAQVYQDFIPAEGELVFGDQETRKDILIQIVDDDTREPTQTFEVQLSDPSPGAGVINFRRFVSNPTAIVSITDDDMKPGTFKMEKPSFNVPESIRHVKIGVMRVDGRDGEIRVKYKTVPKTAQVYQDFIPAEGELVFGDQETRKDILIQIVDDDTREPTQTFEVQLSDPSPGAGVINFRRFVSNPTAIISITDDDMKSGLLQLEEVVYQFFENVGTVRIPVVRVNGSDGEILVFYRTEPKTALVGSDFVFSSGEIIFEEGESRKFVEIQILNDDVREEVESFEIALMPTEGVGDRQKAELYILDDDMTPGFLEIEQNSYEVLENAGQVRIGVVRLGGKHGQIRVRYRTVASSAVAQRDFLPTEGELVFEEGEEKKYIVVQILNDNVREFTELFVVQLLQPTAGQGVINFRGLGSITETTVTIQDDDKTLGLFEFEQVSYEVRETVGTVNVDVIRKGGSDGEVRIGYQTVPKTAQSSTDFQPTSGELVFEDGETKKTIFIRILNDDVRETTETFEIRLLNPTPPQGFIDFRGLGQKHTALVTIFDDDGNPGFLELEQPTYVVSEGIRTLQVVVKRRGGSDGRIQCRYRTTAKSALEGIDFEPGSGDLIFEDGETQKTISIQILNDKIKESIKSFEVQLLDPLPAQGIFNFRVVGSRKLTMVSIADDDTNPGLLQMEIPSFTVKESIGSIHIPVVRVNGSDGQILVRYQSVPGTAQEGVDFTPFSGDLVFEDGESKKFISLQIVDDRMKEPTESFGVRLMDPSPGPGVLNFRGMGFLSQSMITILDDDMNHGFLELESPSYHFSEGSGEASIGVVRLDGADGKIKVRYQTVPKTAIPGKDYVDASGELVFEDGVRRKDITVQILNDHRKEATKTFEVQLFEAAIEGEDVGFRGLGSKSISLVSIWDDDQHPGVFQFRESQTSVREGLASVSMTIVRTEGSDGSVSLRLRTVDSSARLGEDYVFRHPIVSFSDGEVEKTLNIDIIDDNTPEGTEHFKVGLFDPTNGAILGPTSIFAVTILDNDGFAQRPSVSMSQETRIFFPENSVTVPSGSRRAKFKIRRDGADIPLSVHLETFDDTARAGVDYRRTLGEVSFKPDEIELTVTINLMNNPKQIEPKLFMVKISNPSTGVVVRGKDLLTINIGEPVGGRRRSDLSNPAGISPGNMDLPPVRTASPLTGLPAPGPFTPMDPSRPVLPAPGPLSPMNPSRPALPAPGPFTPMDPSRPALPAPGPLAPMDPSRPALPAPGPLAPMDPSRSSLPQSQRPGIPRGQQDCSPGLIFNPCFFGCPQVCNIVADAVCNKGCSPTCVCPSGLILESLHSARCVPPSQCPRGGYRVQGGGAGLGGLLGGVGGSVTRGNIEPAGGLLGGLLG